MISIEQLWNKYKSCEVYDVSELPQEIQDSIKLAKEASLNAYAPYSKYSVGAVLVTKSGRQISSENTETCNYDAVCAEAGAISEWVKLRYKSLGENRSAEEEISYIVTFGKPDVEESSLRNDVFVTPCGRCRQRLYEHCKDNTPVITCSESGDKARLFKLSDLLPFAFTPMNL